MVQRLIVPVDGSDTSWRAVDVALSLARRTTAIVHIVEVVFSSSDTSHAQTRLEEGVAQIDVLDVEIDVEVLISDETVASAIDSAVTDSPGSTVTSTDGRSMVPFGGLFGLEGVPVSARGVTKIASPEVLSTTDA